MRISVTADDLVRLRCALDSAKYTSGTTHGFYLYPARFSPEIARDVIEIFSKPGDWVLDPFMGGGTAIVEGLALGRSMIGIDLNALAHFVASVRTRPLSPNDETLVRKWADGISSNVHSAPVKRLPRIENLPHIVRTVFSGALVKADGLPFRRQQAFARCALLRLGQWALDCRDVAAPSRRKLAEKLPQLTHQMLSGLEELVDQCRLAGVRKSEIVSRRVLLSRNAIGLEKDPQIRSLRVRPRLVFTSPPYSCVHVLYHRWQVRGRKETSAPYWIAQVPDGYYGSHYTGGSRSPTGERNYFSMITSVFTSVRRFMAPDGIVVQLVGFADVRRQLPRYLDAMIEAGFEEVPISKSQKQLLWRHVPNRKWYAKLQGSVDASSEILLFHQPRR